METLNPEIAKTLLRAVTDAGQLLLRYFGRVKYIRQKGPQSSVVCEADLASEELVARRIRLKFPGARIIGEEGGTSGSASELTWVVDPLDGTSNFVAGLPWFGAQAGVLIEGEPVCAAMCLPVEGLVYFAEKGRGVLRNGVPVSVAPEPDPRKMLCAFGFDGSRARQEQTGRLVVRVGNAFRNTRTTNSLFDFCYTIDGRLGACVNLNCKIWDIVPAALMFPEAGGVFSDIDGKNIDFSLGEKNPDHSYKVAGANKAIHKRLIRILRGS